MQKGLLYFFSHLGLVEKGRGHTQLRPLDLFSDVLAEVEEQRCVEGDVVDVHTACQLQLDVRVDVGQLEGLHVEPEEQILDAKLSNAVFLAGKIVL